MNSLMGVGAYGGSGLNPKVCPSLENLCSTTGPVWSGGAVLSSV